MTDAPERIWAAECRQTNSTMWWSDDAGGVGTEYVRADLAPAPTVKVKALVWVGNRASTPWGDIVLHFGENYTEYKGLFFEKGNHRKAAKAAAQADYEARIIAALDTP